MRIRMLALATAAITTTALAGHAVGLAEPPEHTGPAEAGTPAAAIGGQARIEDRSVVLHTDAGSLQVDGNQLRITDSNGVALTAIPLTVIRQDTVFPVDAQVDGTTATLTPRADLARPATAAERTRTAQLDAEARTTEPILLAQHISDTPEDRMNTAMANVNNELTVALAVGTLLGAIVGGPLGCVFTGALGTAAAGPLGTIVGCLAGAVVGAGMGVVVFNLIIGVPALIASAVHYYNVMTAPPAPEAND
ncbi:hypothetical protein [Nocardia sp. NPDC020380]|uniref:hypothetical protein n=1 Tax=Nocardia sp. NPDC020380 TaxID=3364309 RepID=UPI0037BC88DC